MTVGFNSTKETWNGCQYGIHAEIDAMQKLNRLYKNKRNVKRIKRVDLLVIRLGRLGDYRSSKPCEKCLETLYKMESYKVRYIYYSTENGTIVREKFKDLYDKRHEYKTRRFMVQFY